MLELSITEYPLADDEVNFVGQTVAIVLADSRYAAEDGAEAVDVDYEELPAVVECQRALPAGAPLAHDGAPGNRLARVGMSFGDVEQAFGAAEHVLGEAFLQHRGGCHSMETRGAVVHHDPDGDGLTLWCSTQSPYLVRRALARHLDEDEERVRVIAPDVGGGFGPKAGFYPEDVAVSLAARQLGVPVKWIEDRREHFVATNAMRDQHWETEVACDSTGRILGLRGHAVVDCGAFARYGVILPLTTLAPPPGAYAIPAIEITMDAAYTNTTPTSPVRGAGRPYAIFVIERMVQLIARELGLDAADVRRRNLVPPEAMPYETGAKYRDGSAIRYDSGDFPACLEKAIALADYDTFPERRDAGREQGRYLGIGVSTCTEDTGVGPYEGATVRVTGSGNVAVRTGAASQGQGHHTIVAQIVADELGVLPEQVTVESADTGKFPHGVGSIGSRVAANVGPASFVAARAVREKALALAARALEADEDDLELEAGVVTVAGSPESRVSLGEVAVMLSPMAAGQVPEGFAPSLEATSYRGSDATPIANGTNVAEVEVDIETGAVTILRYSVAHDCGVMINPSLVDGQIVGGVIHGVSNTLYEHVIFSNDGQPVTTSYADYLLPTAAESPAVEIVHQESPSPLNPIGVKGAGEGGTIPATPAIVAAIESALAPFGVTLDRYPVEPEALVAAIRCGLTPAA